MVSYENGNGQWVVPQNVGNFLTGRGNITFWRILLDGEEIATISDDAILLNTSTRDNSLTFILQGLVSKLKCTITSPSEGNRLNRNLKLTR